MQARDHHQTNIKIRKWIPIGILCSLGLSACISASCMAASATITIGNMSGRNILEPGAGRSKGEFYVPVSIKVQDAKNYTVSIKAENDGKLIDSTTSKFIPTTDSAGNIDSLTNAWGLRINYGDTVSDDKAKNYSPVPTTPQAVIPSGSGTVTGTPNGVEENKVLTLGYGANVEADFPAGNYKGTITINVVASPYETIHSITYMQDMSHDICSNTTTPVRTASAYDDTGDKLKQTGYIPRTMLLDSRDQHWYIVSKLADGNCWMTENLALAGGTTLTPADSNVAADYTLPASEEPEEGSTTRLKDRSDGTIPFSTNSGTGDYTAYVFDGDAKVNANYKVNYNLLSKSQKTAQIEASRNTAAHPGAWYSFQAVTANSATVEELRPFDYDICPANWTLPRAAQINDFVSTTYQSVADNLDLAFQNGLVAYIGLFGGGDRAGQEGSINNFNYWWSRTSDLGTTASYLLNRRQENDYFLAQIGRSRGLSARCIAK